MNSDTAITAAGVPPVGISGLKLLGLALPDWVLIGTAVYTLLATYVLVRDKIYRPWKEARDGQQRNTAGNP